MLEDHEDIVILNYQFIEIDDVLVAELPKNRNFS